MYRGSRRPAKSAPRVFKRSPDASGIRAGELNAIRKHKCFLCSPFYVKGVSLGQVGGKLKPKGPAGDSLPAAAFTARAMKGPRHRPTVGSLGVRFLMSEVPLYTRPHQPKTPPAARVSFRDRYSYEPGIRASPPNQSRGDDAPYSLAMLDRYRGTSLIRKCHPLGPCSTTVPRTLCWPYGCGRFL